MDIMDNMEAKDRPIWKSIIGILGVAVLLAIGIYIITMYIMFHTFGISEILDLTAKQRILLIGLYILWELYPLGLIIVLLHENHDEH